MKEIVEKINQAIDTLLEKDKVILTRGLGERIISNRLADYLRPLFEHYDVDSEYDGDINKPNDRKVLGIAKNRVNNINITKKRPRCGSICIGFSFTLFQGSISDHLSRLSGPLFV